MTTSSYLDSRNIGVTLDYDFLKVNCPFSVTSDSQSIGKTNQNLTHVLSSTSVGANPFAAKTTEFVMKPNSAAKVTITHVGYCSAGANATGSMYLTSDWRISRVGNAAPTAVQVNTVTNGPGAPNPQVTQFLGLTPATFSFYGALTIAVGTNNTWNWTAEIDVIFSS